MTEIMFDSMLRVCSIKTTSLCQYKSYYTHSFTGQICERSEMSQVTSNTRATWKFSFLQATNLSVQIELKKTQEVGARKLLLIINCCIFAMCDVMCVNDVQVFTFVQKIISSCIAFLLTSLALQSLLISTSFSKCFKSVFKSVLQLFEY